MSRIANNPVAVPAAVEIREDGQLLITADTEDDLSLEQLTLKQKGAFFSEVFGIQPVLRKA